MHVDPKTYDTNKVIIKIKYHADIDPLENIGGKDKSGWIDLRSAEDVFIPVGELKLLSLGVSMQLPKGYEAIVAPRSSTFKNYGLIVANSVGIIDNDYCGDEDIWRLAVYCLSPKMQIMDREGTYVHFNDRIAQFRIQKIQPDIEFEPVYELGNADRGGFGTTGV